MYLQVGDIEGDMPSAKRLKVSSSDALQDMVSGEELSLYSSAPNNAESSQVVSVIVLLYTLSTMNFIKVKNKGARTLILGMMQGRFEFLSYN